MGELLPVAMDHVDRVVHADPDRQRGDDRGDQRVGNVQQRHRAQNPDEDEHDRPDRYDGQRGPAQRHPEEDGEDAEGDRDGRADRLCLPVGDLVRDGDRQNALRRGGDRSVVAGPERLDLLLDHRRCGGVVGIGRELEQDRVRSVGVVDQDACHAGIHCLEPVEELLHQCRIELNAGGGFPEQGGETGIVLVVRRPAVVGPVAGQRLVRRLHRPRGRLRAALLVLEGVAEVPHVQQRAGLGRLGLHEHAGLLRRAADGCLESLHVVQHGPAPGQDVADAEHRVESRGREAERDRHG